MLTRGSPRAAYFFEKPDTSTFRYRVFNVSQALAEGTPGGPSSAWFDQDEFDRMDRVIDLCDLLVVCRARYTHRVANMIERAKTRGRRVIFDCDDLVFDLSHTHMIMDTLGQALEAGHVWDQWFANIGRVAATFALCDGAVVTNPYLAQRARDAFADDRPIRILPNFLEPRQQALSADIWQAKAESGWSRDDTVHLGYFSGTPTHNRDFALIAGVIARIMDDDPRLRLRIVGFLDLGPELARHTTRIEFLPLQDYLNLQRLIGEVEVNLVPLQVRTQMVRGSSRRNPHHCHAHLHLPPRYRTRPNRLARRLAELGERAARGCARYRRPCRHNLASPRVRSGPPWLEQSAPCHHRCAIRIRKDVLF